MQSEKMAAPTTVVVTVRTSVGWRSLADSASIMLGVGGEVVVAVFISGPRSGVVRP